MTGPLAPLFAQLGYALAKHRLNEELLDGRDFDAKQHDANAAALSSIERHVQDMERALAQADYVASLVQQAAGAGENYSTRRAALSVPVPDALGASSGAPSGEEDS